jgi:hypothetical protein
VSQHRKASDRHLSPWHAAERINYHQLLRRMGPLGFLIMDSRNSFWWIPTKLWVDVSDDGHQLFGMKTLSSRFLTFEFMNRNTCACSDIRISMVSLSRKTGYFCFPSSLAGRWQISNQANDL